MKVRPKIFRYSVEEIGRIREQIHFGEYYLYSFQSNAFPPNDYTQDAWLNSIRMSSSEVGMSRPCTAPAPSTAGRCAHFTRGACYSVFFRKVQPMTQTKGKRRYFDVGEASHFSKWNRVQNYLAYHRVMFLKWGSRSHLEWFLHKQCLRLKPRPTELKSLGPRNLHF